MHKEPWKLLFSLSLAALCTRLETKEGALGRQRLKLFAVLRG